MKKYLLTFGLFVIYTSLFGQATDSFPTKSEFNSLISKLTMEIKILEKNNADLQQINSIQKKQIDNINSQLSDVKLRIKQIEDSLDITTTNVSSSNIKNQKQFQIIHETIISRTLYWIIAILAVTFLSILVFFILRNKLSASTRNLDSQIARTNETLQNEAIKLDSKLVEILQTQLSILQEERKINCTPTTETDHKLPLKVGEEIHRMRKRIENIPQDIKGLGALTNSLKRLEEEFNDSGYEIEDLSGKKYVDGMKVEARFVDNPDIPKGEEIITDVLRPQIKYKGVVIQVAKVEVGKS